MFHKHKWVKIKETFAPDYEYKEIFIDYGNPHTEESKICKGLTTILWECEICHKIRKKEMLGKEVEK